MDRENAAQDWLQKIGLGSWLVWGLTIGTTEPTLAAPAIPSNPQPTAAALDLDSKQIQSSPVLHRWLQRIPQVSTEIDHDPSFRPLFRFGYVHFPSSRGAAGFSLGLEDIGLRPRNLTLSADYQSTGRGNRQHYRQSWGAELHYYALPLGKPFNIAPIVGYRHLETQGNTISGMNLGVRLLWVASRGGGADLRFSQSWVSPFSETEVSLSTLSVGYALTRQLRIGSEWQIQNSRLRKDRRWGIALEWML